MYDNIGQKIMVLAKVVPVILLSLGAIVWLIMIIEYESPFAWIALGIGMLSFVLSWPLYGFGQLIDDVHRMQQREATNRNLDSHKTITFDDLPDL